MCTEPLGYQRAGERGLRAGTCASTNAGLGDEPNRRRASRQQRGSPPPSTVRRRNRAARRPSFPENADTRQPPPQARSAAPLSCPGRSLGHIPPGVQAERRSHSWLPDRFEQLLSRALILRQVAVGQKIPREVGRYGPEAGDALQRGGLPGVLLLRRRRHVWIRGRGRDTGRGHCVRSAGLPRRGRCSSIGSNVGVLQGERCLSACRVRMAACRSGRFAVGPCSAVRRRANGSQPHYRHRCDR